MIKGAAQPIPAASAGWTQIARPSGKFSYSIFVAPLATGNEDLLFGSCRVLVLVHDFVGGRPIAADMLCDHFALTPTEVRLAGALASGHSLESAAAVQNMQIATARSHLKAIFAKVGVHRQQDLVRLRTSLSAIQI